MEDPEAGHAGARTKNPIPMPQERKDPNAQQKGQPQGRVENTPQRNDDPAREGGDAFRTKAERTGNQPQQPRSNTNEPQQPDR